MKAFAIVLALLVCSAGTPAVQKNRKPVTHAVTMDATSFKPSSLKLKAGDSVVWVNKDVIPHTASSKEAGVFDSGTIAVDQSWKTTLETKGKYSYVCLFHPTMTGTLLVE